MKRHLAYITAAFFIFVVAVSPSFSADGADVYKKCVACHGSDGSKAPDVIKGQSSEALMKKMQGYADGSFGGAKKNVMVQLAKKLSPEETKAVCDYIAKF